MKHILTIIGLLGIIVRGVAAADQGDQEALPPGEYHLTKLPFEQLSDRNVSRQGDAALAIKTVNWEHSECDHFIFHTESGFAVPQLTVWAEWSYASIKSDLGIAEDLFERKCHVYIFLNEEAWREFVGSSKMEPWTGGWCTGRELFLWARPNFRFQGTTLPHEMTHLVLYRFVGGDIPLWLNEGLAEFEGIRLYRNYVKLRGRTLTNVRDHVDPDQYITLNNLTTAVDYPRSKDEVVAFYIESQRLINFLYHQDGGPVPLVKFLKLQAQGSRFDSAWQEIYSSKYTDLATFETKFRTYATKSKE